MPRRGNTSSQDHEKTSPLLASEIENAVYPVLLMKGKPPTMEFGPFKNMYFWYNLQFRCLDTCMYCNPM